MKQTTIVLAGVFFLSTALVALAQQAQPMPAATQTQIDCSGFISASKLSKALTILNGSDNDFQSPVRQYSTGDYVFLRERGSSVAVGTEYRVVREARSTFEEYWYAGQAGSIRSLGHPYDDVGRIKVTKLTPQGAISQVTFACDAVLPGDIVIPYQPRAIPEYTPSTEFDRFALPNGKMMGAITAAQGNQGVMGLGSIVYINRGQEDGVQPGQRFRIFRLVRDSIEGLLALRDTPRESTGEMVILTTQEKSSVGIIVRSLRDIELGDGIELE